MDGRLILKPGHRPTDRYHRFTSQQEESYHDSYRLLSEAVVMVSIGVWCDKITCYHSRDAHFACIMSGRTTAQLVGMWSRSARDSNNSLCGKVRDRVKWFCSDSKPEQSDTLSGFLHCRDTARVIVLFPILHERQL